MLYVIWAVIRAYFRFCGWVGQAIFLAAIASIVEMFLLAAALDWVVAGLNLAERTLVESRPTDWVKTVTLKGLSLISERQGSSAV